MAANVHVNIRKEHILKWVEGLQWVINNLFKAKSPCSSIEMLTNCYLGDKGEILCDVESVTSDS